MKREPVDSSTFNSIGYDPTLHMLEAEFTHGEIYRYYDVPWSLWRRFRRAPSKGRFFAYNIRDRFPYARVGD